MDNIDKQKVEQLEELMLKDSLTKKQADAVLFLIKKRIQK